MARGSDDVRVEVDGHSLRLTNLSKVFYPATGFTKGEVIDYYARVAPALLPHLKGRPLTLKRYPNGVDEPFFYQKDCPLPRPDWVRTSDVWSEHRDGPIRYCVVEDLASLVWLVNLADLEFHTFLHRADDVDTPTAIAFDLDPGPGASLLECAQVAVFLRRWLADAGLEGYPKTSGSKGLQVYVPLNTPTTYAETKTFARTAAERLESAHADLITSNMRKDLREGRVFIDWSQNDDHKTTVCVYSLRARERPTVSTPLDWSEIEAALKAGRADTLRFDSKAVLDRVRLFGDRFAPVLTQRQRLPRSVTAQRGRDGPQPKGAARSATRVRRRQ